MTEFAKAAKIYIFKPENEIYELIGESILQFGWDSSVQAIVLYFTIDNHTYETNLIHSWVDRENNAYWEDQDQNLFRASFESQADVMEFAFAFVKGNSNNSHENTKSQFESTFSENNQSLSVTKKNKILPSNSTNSSPVMDFPGSSNSTLLTISENKYPDSLLVESGKRNIRKSSSKNKENIRVFSDLYFLKELHQLI
ncbi:uncharacterized protein LOC111631121 isoform X2 [Centruroides sculpturatus]|uniref:uncharacterized protein LOC111631121 isoform X2 n=1 Tax=Centruroides sculpturatus TaxID=218467 RepID=UPI000C6EBE6A|nr:uncharacterized protein LOC111631121 isoform X2 [Centruroides sculpturatus]